MLLSFMENIETEKENISDFTHTKIEKSILVFFFADIFLETLHKAYDYDRSFK